MADTSAQKNKKSKKKSEANDNPVIVTLSNNSKTKYIDASAIANNNNTDMLLVPEGSNSKSQENNEVTVMQNDKKEHSDEASGKKKKKSKKKSKEEPKDIVMENSNTKSLLDFSENGIHLVNHPEISVTFTEAAKPDDDKLLNVEDKVTPTDETENQDIPAAPSKKKKKKKKKSQSDVPPVPVSSNENTTVATPTYTKVVTADNTCVLVVNNENFSVSTKPAINLENKENKVTENDIKFSVPSEKIGDVINKSLAPDNIKLSNSVSIFPVFTNDNSNILSEENISMSSTQNPDAVLNDENKADETISKENSDESKLTKSQLKAERRAKQEAQRAAKLAKSTSKVDNNSPKNIQNKNANKEKSASNENVSNKTELTGEKTSKLSVEKQIPHKARLFPHLPQCRQFDTNADIHPAILEIGFQYSRGIICGSNARCIALLAALMEIISDYIPQPNKNISRDLESNIQLYLNFLSTCRPLSVSMVNAVKILKHQINQMPSEIDVDKAKENLCKFINNFVNEEILLAKKAIANSASAKIVDGDVILVFAHSSVVKDVLYKAFNENTRFRVVIADSRPKMEGLEMLRCLVKRGLECSYVSVNGISNTMKEVSKVIIGAHALLANGCVMSRIGSKEIALAAASYSVPVLVCCETYKFCERVLTDSFVQNEVGEPEDIINTSLISNDSLKNWHSLSSLDLLNLLYDVTPSDLISMVVTEKGVLPCTSVPVVLRVRYAGFA